MPIDLREIEYLAFEGGGGKGNAYLGAVKYLDEKHILEKIKGFSGASAGAITSALLSCGYRYSEIEYIFRQTDFNEFFDLPIPGNIVTFKGVSDQPVVKKEDWVSRTFLKDVFLLSAVFTGLHFLKGFWDFKRQNKFLYERFSITGTLDKYRECLANDLGLFSGVGLFNFFNNFINNAYYQKLLAKNSSSLNDPEDERWIDSYLKYRTLKIPYDSTLVIQPPPFITFKQHFEIFQKDLKVTAVNLQTGQLEILSHDTTPSLPVALGIRMSMSLPLIFKPVQIREQDLYDYKDASGGEIEQWEKEILDGLWIDGGVLDNAPVRVFDQSKTILFRLGTRTQVNEVMNLSQFLSTWVLLGTMGAGSATTSKTSFNNDLIIQLDTFGTDLLKFNLEDKPKERLIESNYNITKAAIEKNKVNKIFLGMMPE